MFCRSCVLSLRTVFVTASLLLYNILNNSKTKIAQLN